MKHGVCDIGASDQGNLVPRSAHQQKEGIVALNPKRLNPFEAGLADGQTPADP